MERGGHQGGSYQATKEGKRVMPSGSVGLEIRAGTRGTSSPWSQRVRKGNEHVKKLQLTAKREIIKGKTVL